jgi:hypothetical protein
MNKALDFLLKYYIIYPNVFKIRCEIYKTSRKIILQHILSGIINRIAYCLSKHKIFASTGNGIFFRVEQLLNWIERTIP